MITGRLQGSEGDDIPMVGFHSSPILGLALLLLALPHRGVISSTVFPFFPFAISWAEKLWRKGCQPIGVRIPASLPQAG